MTRPPAPRLILFFTILLLLLSGCASAAVPTPSAAHDQGQRAVEPSFAPVAGSTTGSEIANSTGQNPAERLVIQNANLSIVVASPSDAMDHISALAQEMNGFVVNANLYETQLDSGAKVPRASITIRVPAERLTEAIQRIEGESDRPPLSRSLESQDVTSDYTDLQSRLRNLENTEAQLTKIMDAATKTEDVLSVYNQLVQVREQIEVTKGRIQFYEQSAALSAIDVDLLANEAVQPLTIGSWQPVGVAKSAIQALINTLKFVANAVIVIVLYVLPVLLVLYVLFILPLSLIWRAWRKRRARIKAAQASATLPASSPPSAPSA